MVDEQFPPNVTLDWHTEFLQVAAPLHESLFVRLQTFPGGMFVRAAGVVLEMFLQVKFPI
jgi:hypothetical protein